MTADTVTGEPDTVPLRQRAIPLPRNKVGGLATLVCSTDRRIPLDSRHRLSQGSDTKLNGAYPESRVFQFRNGTGSRILATREIGTRIGRIPN